MATNGDEIIKFRINLKNLRELVWRRPDIKPIEKVVLLDLMFYAGIDGESYPPLKLLAKNHNISTRYASKVIKRLNEIRCIDWVRGGFGRSNRYYFTELLYSPIEELPPHRNSSSNRKSTAVPVDTSNTVPTNSSQVNVSHVNEKSTESLKESQHRSGTAMVANATPPKKSLKESSDKSEYPTTSCKLGCQFGQLFNVQTRQLDYCSCSRGDLRRKRDELANSKSI